ncbi:gcn5-related n-acetyltransferase [Grosmannia clavigera kw1407]|uniref:Gcn5-related n-acetyltransferase n=1 Tax=Grosmannia clavigera (strain kw1407 / UAMH 11150) TaxID=655863 RepID=F0X8W6_GROCL|nr:gcn5-related n-acetyltransferase [Grosmannia clavigera kw1407]EFX05347.1 gcn5-related n-acetyltransferase [Grosmannia clavigera kw1407]
MAASILDLSPDNIVIRPLSVADHAASIAVENAAFTNPNHRASPDKLSYRLTACPELSLGLFAKATAADGELEMESDASGNILVAHIIATRCHGRLASDASMNYPKDWRTTLATTVATENGTPIGHDPTGTTVALHSLAVAPVAQRKGAGSRLVQAFVDKMGRDTPADHVAIICQDYLVNYYKKLGFALVGPSAAQFGGGGWYDMIYDLPKST